METVVIVDLTKKEDIPKLEKCCFFASLKLGLSVWILIEILIWGFLCVSALCFEIYYINEVDLVDFVNETETWYFYLIFGDRIYYIDQHIRSKYLQMT